MANKLSALVEQVQLLEKKMKDEGKDALHEAFKEFFENHPEAARVVWTQYTPYFNDGDACTFRVNEMELKVKEASSAEELEGQDGENEDEDDYEDDGYGHGDSCYVSKLEAVDRDNEYQNKYYPNRECRELTPQEKSLVKDFCDLSKACDEIPQVLQLVLGDHCKVVATPDGFEVDEYDHD